MRNMLLGGVVAAGLLAPVAGYAQPAASSGGDSLVTVRPDQWLAVGAGVVVGALLLDVVATSQVATVAGGVVGGYIAYLSYGGRYIELRTAQK